MSPKILTRAGTLHIEDGARIVEKVELITHLKIGS
jgi:hypothetical protein